MIDCLAAARTVAVMAGCAVPEDASEAEATPRDLAVRRPGGTTRRIGTLKVLIGEQRAHTAGNSFLNSERLDALKEIQATHTGADALSSRQQIADERLRAGQTREAIIELETLTSESHPPNRPIAARSRSLFERLVLRVEVPS